MTIQERHSPIDEPDIEPREGWYDKPDPEEEGREYEPLYTVELIMKFIWQLSESDKRDIKWWLIRREDYGSRMRAKRLEKEFADRMSESECRTHQNRLRGFKREWEEIILAPK
jgi:hypothetical protein